ncbi:pleiotropic drug resistance protein 3-like isoform X2 [Humulus lupulus]|uniref:pleiotropic drug resistance protein 3-like isoform X2 n=1 Tax=Humulus lupulus TaxID=3486 RepID=UPI002B407EAF|nr:pleiotropic drug resistance protein 3-like isoform X2 [Humulus lupulus]
MDFDVGIRKELCNGYTKSLFCFWNAIEKLPTFERLRSKEDDNGDQKDDDDDDKEAKKRVVDDVTKLGAQERHCFIEKLIKHIESDNLRILRKIRNRIDKVGVKLPTVEVRYKYLRVEAECEVVHGKPRPTLWNSFKRLISGLTKISGLRLGKAKISLFKDVSGVIMSGRLTLLLGPPGCGKTTLLKVLSVNLDSSLKLTGKVSYNGYKLEEFLPEKTAAYVSQFDKLIPEMTVRETLEFSARCQGVGSRAEIMKEISRKENEAGIVPDPDIDTFMKVSASLVTVHLIDKLAAGDTGSLSVSILQKMSTMSKKLRSHPAFSKLLAQYSQSGYSEGKELNNLILSDLYYHLEGELEGRKISTRPFKELSEYLVDSKVMHNYQNKYDNDFLVTCKDVYMFDPERVRADFGSDLWDYLKWKTSKEITKRMLSHMMEANSMVLLRNSKLAALKSLITVLTIYEKDVSYQTLIAFCCMSKVKFRVCSCFSLVSF